MFQKSEERNDVWRKFETNSNDILISRNCIAWHGHRNSELSRVTMRIVHSPIYWITKCKHGKQRLYSFFKLSICGRQGELGLSISIGQWTELIHEF